MEKKEIYEIKFMLTPGIEPELTAWKTAMLPLHHASKKMYKNECKKIYKKCLTINQYIHK